MLHLLIRVFLDLSLLREFVILADQAQLRAKVYNYKKVRSYADLSVVYYLLVPVLARRRIIPTLSSLAAYLRCRKPRERYHRFR